MKTLLVIAGPTAVGKTSIAIDVAERLGTSILSADSRQCYEGMRIGTAQPSAAELAAVPHYFINSFPVTEHITAAAYERFALSCLHELFEERDIVIACGGTGLYIKALCEGLDEMPEVPAAIVQEVEEGYRSNGIGWLQDAVAQADPLFFQKGESQNPARLMRALSFARATGRSILDFRSGVQKERAFRILKIALELPRDVLYQRINDRVEAMMAAGLLDEVKSLLPHRGSKNLQTVGYAELFDYLDGKLSLNEAVTLIRQHTRNYAKRQLTWFRKDAGMHWLRADAPDVARQILAQIKNL